MTSLEALKKLFFDNKDLRVDITLNDRKVCELYNIISDDLERLKNLEEKHEKLSIEIDELLDNKLELVVKNIQQDMLITELRKENKELLVNKNVAQGIATKYKKALDILKDKLDIKLEIYHNGGCTLNHKIISKCITPNDRCLRYLEVEQYELLMEVFGNDK